MAHPLKRLGFKVAQARTIAMAVTQTPVPAKKEGDISDSFVSLSGTARPPLPQRFLDLKRGLVHGHEDAVTKSWRRLLAELKKENELVAREGSSVVPSVDFRNLDRDLVSLRRELKKRGVAIIRNVVPENEAREYKNEIEQYVKLNPSTKGLSLYPGSNPQCCH